MSLSTARIQATNDVDYTIPIYSDYLSILSMYNFSHATRNIDLMQTYLSFDLHYYIALFTTFLLLMWAWNLSEFVAYRISIRQKKQISRSRNSIFWILLRAFLDQVRFPQLPHISFTLIAVLSSWFFVMFICKFMMNMLSTDLVIIVKPRVFKDYGDIVRNEELKVLVVTTAIESDFFKNAAEGTMENLIWGKRYEMKSVSKSVIEGLILKLSHQEIVLIVREWMAYFVGSLALSYLPGIGMNNLRVYLVRDSTGKNFVNAFMLSKNVNPVIKKFSRKM